MTHEIRNLKGEIVEYPDDEEPWYHLSMTTWFLIGGLILFNIGCFINMNLMGILLRFFDFRLWPWWYFPILFLIVVFSIKWYLLFLSWDDLDPMDTGKGKLFLRMSITITVELLMLILLKATKLISFLSFPLWDWFTYGAYSHLALFAFLLICAAIAITIYVVKEWSITAFSS